MSIYRDPRSPYYRYDFQISGYRFSGSTKLRDERDAAAFEEARKAEARRIVEQIRAAGAEPLTLQAACDRWWAEHGSILSDAKIKSALDRLVEIIGGKTFLDAINDDVVSRMVEERRKDVRRDRTIKDGDERTILYGQSRRRPSTARSRCCAAWSAAHATIGMRRSLRPQHGKGTSSKRSAWKKRRGC